MEKQESEGREGREEGGKGGGRERGKEEGKMEKLKGGKFKGMDGQYKVQYLAGLGM